MGHPGQLSMQPATLQIWRPACTDGSAEILLRGCVIVLKPQDYGQDHTYNTLRKLL